MIWRKKEAAAAQSAGAIEAFSFGDPVPVSSLPDVFGTWAYVNGEWYESPIPFTLLAKSYRATAYHGSAIQLKRNILARAFVPSPMLSRSEFAAWVLDFLVFGNGYLQRHRARSRKPLMFSRLMAKYVRRGVDLSEYWWVPDWYGGERLPRGDVFHLMEADLDQEIYGVPDYLGALQATWLNESATLFRRKYYNNGSHAGFILYISDPAQDREDIDRIRTALRESKGPGNFRNLFLYSPSGKPDGVKLIPVSEVAAKDDFLNISTVSRDAQLAGHRVPPQLIGLVPTNSAGFGSVAEAVEAFLSLEVEPLQARALELNEWAGESVVQFRPLEPPPNLDPTR